MFKDYPSLQRIIQDLLPGAMLAFSSQDVMRFVGRKLHGNFQDQVITDLKKRAAGWRVKHYMAGNSI